MNISKRYKRALVTGGAGFIGSHLVEALLGEGLEVVCLDDYTSGKKQNLEHLSMGKLKIAECDVTDYSSLEQWVAGCDVVFHQAASKMTVCLRDPARDLEVNANGTLNLLLLSKKHGVKKFVHASTGSVYGIPKSFPTDEEHSLNPVSYYGVSKLAGEKYVRAFGELYDMDVTVLRYFHVFGPRQDHSDVGGVVSIFARNALRKEPITIFGDGEQLRSFTFVKDVVEINKLVAMHPNARGGVYNCASSSQITIRELADGVLHHYNMKGHEIVYQDWKIGDIKYFRVDNNRIRELGFQFQYGFEEGLIRTLDWYTKYFRESGFANDGR